MTKKTTAPSLRDDQDSLDNSVVGHFRLNNGERLKVNGEQQYEIHFNSKDNTPAVYGRLKRLRGMSINLDLRDQHYQGKILTNKAGRLYLRAKIKQGQKNSHLVSAIRKADIPIVDSYFRFEIMEESGQSTLRFLSVVSESIREHAPQQAEIEAESFDAQERAAGFQADPEIRRIVETYAMERAEKTLTGLGFRRFKDTSKQDCYDYTCEREGTCYYVEVKGTQGPGTSIILTKNELEHNQKYQLQSIAVIVHDVKVDRDKGLASGGTPLVLCPWILELAAVEPIQYRWIVSKQREPHL